MTNIDVDDDFGVVFVVAVGGGGGGGCAFDGIETSLAMTVATDLGDDIIETVLPPPGDMTDIGVPGDINVINCGPVTLVSVTISSLIFLVSRY